jgi:hypothetical protein
VPRLSRTAGWEGAERLRKAEIKGKKKKKKDVVHKSRMSPLASLEPKELELTKSSCTGTGAGAGADREGTPACGCGPGADQQGENLDGLLSGLLQLLCVFFSQRAEPR